MKPAPVVYWVNRWTWQVWPKAQLVYIGGAANCGKMRDSKQLHTVASSSTLSQAAPHCRKQLHTVASSSTLSQAAPHCPHQLRIEADWIWATAAVDPLSSVLWRVGNRVSRVAAAVVVVNGRRDPRALRASVAPGRPVGTATS